MGGERLKNNLTHKSQVPRSWPSAAGEKVADTKKATAPRKAPPDPRLQDIFDGKKRLGCDADALATKQKTGSPGGPAVVPE
jgi:hypothetical protein